MKLLKVKWENIITLLLSLFFIDCIITHAINGKQDFNSIMLEIIIYGLAVGINYMTIYGFRKELLNK